MNEPAQKTRHLRDVSLWSVEMLEKMGLSLFFTGADDLSEAQARAQIAAMLWAHHVTVPEDDVEAAVEAGTWPDAVKHFKRNPAMLWAMPEVPALIERVRALMAIPEFTAAAGHAAEPEAEGVAAAAA